MLKDNKKFIDHLILPEIWINHKIWMNNEFNRQVFWI